MPLSPARSRLRAVSRVILFASVAAAVGTGALTVTPASASASTPSASTSIADSTRAAGWFVDPRTPAQRKAQLRVPRDPAAYQGKRAETRAIFRTHSGDLAVPRSYASGHQLRRGQAVTLNRAGGFAGKVGSTKKARTQVKRLARSLKTAARVRCEGYADYTEKRAKARAGARAEAVCSQLAKRRSGLKVSTVSHGDSHPAIVGGKAKRRKMNSRVVVVVTAVRRTTAPPPPSLADDVRMVPGAPVLDSVRGGDESVIYGFTAPANDGGSAIVRYEVSTGAGWSTVVDAPAPRAAGGIRGILTGLEAETEVDIQVRAVNGIGAGPASNTLTAAVYGRPSAPTGFDVSGDDQELTLTFSAPARDGGVDIEGYQVSYDDGESWEAAVVDGPAPWTVTKSGLSNGTTYDVRVRAVNELGAGAAATGSALVATVPEAPTGLVVTPGDGELALTFSAPGFDGGSVVTGYEVSYDGGDNWEDVVVDGAAPWTVSKSGLSNGTTYDVRVRAVNEFGAGAAATGSALVATVPGAPTLHAPTVAGRDYTFTFTAPAADGGLAITGYELSTDFGTTWGDFDYVGEEGVFSVTWTAPAWGTDYGLAVRALNERGAGERSDVVAVVPVTVPDAPTNLVATPSGNAVVLTFTPPAFNGGAAITGYQVKTDDGAWTPAVAVGNSITMVGQSWGVHVYSVRAINVAGVSEAVTSNEVELIEPGPQVYRSESYYSGGDYWTSAFFFTVPGAVSYQARLDRGDWMDIEIATDWGEYAYGYIHDPACATHNSCTSSRIVEVRAITEDGPGNPGNSFVSPFLVLG